VTTLTINNVQRGAGRPTIPEAAEAFIKMTKGGSKKSIYSDSQTGWTHKTSEDGKQQPNIYFFFPGHQFNEWNKRLVEENNRTIFEY